MSEIPQSEDLRNIGRTAQIIAGALIAGVLMFAVVAFIVGKGEGPDRMPVVSVIAAAIAGINLVLRFVVPAIVVSSQTKSVVGTAEPKLTQLLAGIYQTKMIVGMAVLEGAAFLNLVAYIVEKQVWSYGVVACLLTVMIISFPSQTQFENWAEDIKRNLK